MTKTNLITGFLGSGKTTSILHLLANKDPAEKWAVLVNEFGEVGIDGALLSSSGAMIKEIPGGCMCCVNGLPMQVGLNTLLRQGKPDRLLIEPTGLGHPKQILDLLTAPVYEPWIDLRATLCLLDPRQLLDDKAVANENFRDQLASVETTQGNIDSALLDLPRLNLAELPASAEHAHSHPVKQGLAALSLPEHQRWRRNLNSGQGYQACGWIFDAETVFDTIGILEWARLAPVDRVKGIMRTPDGLVRINRQGEDFFIETQNVAPPDSRIELISAVNADWNALQSSLLRIRLSSGG